MKRIRSTLFAAFLVLASTSGDAAAWEAATTHAGLTEQSALASSLHSRLREHLAADRGLLATLTVPEADAPKLYDVLRRLNPTHGYVPDARGRMTALSWLVAGSVLADVPVSQAENHFFDPRTGQGLGNATAGGFLQSLRLSALRVGSGASLSPGGEPALQWWRDDDNSLSYSGFADQFRKAVMAQTPLERERHLAGALLAAGGMLHVLQDMGSPSHVRNDIAAHNEQIGTSRSDRGSRFERVAALAFGRLGVPKPVSAPSIFGLAPLFSNAEGTGLADVIESGYFSSGTLPKPTKADRNAGSSTLQRLIQANLRRPEPAPPARLDVVAARNHDGAAWVNEQGVCLTRYQWKRAELQFWIDDSCALEQLETILPQVGAYGIAFLDMLFPGDLRLEASGTGLQVGVDDARYGAGTVHVFADAADGTRTQYHSAQLPAGSQGLLVPAPPAGSARVTVLFDGQDTNGAPLLATTTSSWPVAN